MNEISYRNNKNVLIADQVQYKPCSALLKLHHFKVYPRHHTTSSVNISAHNSKGLNEELHVIKNEDFHYDTRNVGIYL